MNSPNPTPPRKIACDQECEVPDGVDLREVPRPRHAWGDVVACPNDGCERAFLVKTTPDASPQPVEETR